MSRRDEIVKALAASERPAPALKVDPRKSRLEQVVDVMASEHKGDRIRPGGMMRMGAALAADDRDVIRTAIADMDHQKELGRYGDPDAAAKRFGCSRETLEAMADHTVTDYVCHQLQERKSDATLPIPEATRRDLIGAALEMHNSTFTEIQHGR